MTENTAIRNDQIVNALASSIRKGATGLHNVPALLKQIIREDMWRDRVVESTGERATFKYFDKFVEADPPNGLGEHIDTLKRLCADDNEARDLLDQVTQKPDGRPGKTFDNVQGLSDAPTGNSAERALRKLRSDAPELHARVLAGKLSPHAAMVEAGFRKKTYQIPADADDAAIILLRKFSADELQRIVEIIVNHIAVDVS